MEGWLTIVVALSTFVTVLILCLPATYKGQNSIKIGSRITRQRVQILVLGDIGRSPRMQYHALSIARHGGDVDIVGYTDSEIHPDIIQNASITVYSIPLIPKFLSTSNRILFLAFGPLKVVYQAYSIFYVLAYRLPAAKWLLVQNPPSIPTLFIATVICFLRNTCLIIDWHNLGYSILALKLGNDHPLVHVSRWYERILSSSATANLTVTNAMAKVLKRDFRVSTPVLSLHDRPVSTFQPHGFSQRFAFLGKLPETASSVDNLLSGKRRLLVSSTSWTPDEDFSILLEALVDYSELAEHQHSNLPEIQVIITGKGPQKEYFLSQIAALKRSGSLVMVDIKTAWLSTIDYASLLAAADLGVSLHTSSSGVDLPMKVVDMFGAGLPVAGISTFEAWSELVEEGVNGRGFGNAAELKTILLDLFGEDVKKLQILKEGAIKEGRRRWDDEWDPVMGRLLGLCP